MLREVGRYVRQHHLALIALFVALGGSAYAASKVGPNDIAKNAVRSKHIKNGQVTKRDLKADEPFRRVGRPGQPPFGNGGQGDCRWSNNPDFPTPVAFYKDKGERVHLVGLPASSNGPGGDGSCSNGEFDDQLVFTLPSSYRPPTLEVFPVPFGGGAHTVMVVGKVAPNSNVVPGGVYVLEGAGSGGVLDGLDFRAAGKHNGIPISASKMSAKNLLRAALP